MHNKYMRATGRGLSAALALLAFSFAAMAEGGAPADRWLINTGEHGEQDRLSMYPVWTRFVEAVAREAKISPAFLFSSDTTKDLIVSRGGTTAVIVGPAHLVSSALRHGHYVPVGVSSRSMRVVLATLRTSGIRSFADARGKSLGLPSQDAIATYMMRGEANAAGTTMKQYFSTVYYTYYEGALLNALKFGTVDMVAVEDATFDRWQAKGEPVAEVMRTKELPGLAVVAHKSLGKSAINEMREVVSGKSVPVPGMVGASFRTLDPAAFEYVSTLGYFTPRLLEGAELVSAKQARELAMRGVAFFDGRTEDEYRSGHPAGARWLHYVERSTKETDYDASKDELDIGKLPPDKNQEIMFSCGGPECWKSYKSARRAMKEGYKRVYWFRGGIKEWLEAGLPVDKG